MIIEGFSYAAVEAGIRRKNRLDLSLIYCDVPAVAAGVFTRNTVKAAPVLLGRERLQGGKIQAVLINSGIANACTGEQGMAAARACSRLVAEALAIPEDLVQVSSTGVIGEQLDVSRFAEAMDALKANLSADGFSRVAKAIMTTDTVPKTAVRTVMIDGCEVKIFGLAKGSGMIRPDMATMLCYVMTDAAIAAPALQTILSKSVDRSFNLITVDGDTSTNDTVLLLASGRAGNTLISREQCSAGSRFQTVLEDLLLDLAVQIVKDGEGVTKLVTINVVGARDAAQARKAADTIAHSPLVKTAFFGEDANWGRIIAALGRSGATFNADAVDISFDDVMMVRNGLGQGREVEVRATAVLKKDEFSVTVDLKEGAGECLIFTCDLSIDYVKINADYRS